MRRLCAALLLLSAQAVATVTINASFQSPTQKSVPFAYLTLDLTNCGANVPSVPGLYTSLVQKHIVVLPSQLPATTYQNNEITRGNSYSALWHVTASADSNTKRKGPVLTVRITSATSLTTMEIHTGLLLGAQPIQEERKEWSRAAILTYSVEQKAGTGIGGDGTVSILFHELSESESDPQYGISYGWGPPNTSEEGDDCNFVFGTTKIASNGANYNQTIKGHNYLIQEMLALINPTGTNNSGNCVQGK